jgi:hypothetical protein
MIALPRMISYLDALKKTELSVEQLSGPLGLPKWLLEKGIKNLVSNGVLKEKYVRVNKSITKRRLELTVSTREIVDQNRAEILPIEGWLLPGVSAVFLNGQLDSKAVRKRLHSHGLKYASLVYAEQQYIHFFEHLPANYRYKLLHLYLCFITQSDDVYQVQLSYKELARVSGFNIDRVRRLVKLLDKLALVRRIYSRADTERSGISYTRYLVNPAHPILLVTPQFQKLHRVDISEHAASPQKLLSMMSRMGILSSEALNAEEQSKLNGILDAASIANLCLLYDWDNLPKQFVFTTKPLTNLTKSVLLAFKGHKNNIDTNTLPSIGSLVENKTGMAAIKASKDTADPVTFQRAFEDIKHKLDEHVTKQLGKASKVYRHWAASSFSIAIYLYLIARPEYFDIMRLSKSTPTNKDWIYVPAELSHTLSPVIYLVPKTPASKQLGNVQQIIPILTSPDKRHGILIGVRDNSKSV